MVAKSYVPPTTNIIDIINDLSSLVAFLHDKDAMDAVYQNAIEQAKLLDDEQTKADEARKYITSNQDILVKIETASDKLTKQQIMHNREVSEFSAYKKQQDKYFSDLQISLDNDKKVLLSREDVLAEKERSLYEKTSSFDVIKQATEAGYAAKEAALNALEEIVNNKKSALELQEKDIQEKFDRLKSIIG